MKKDTNIKKDFLTSHYSSYPKGEYPVVLSYAFRLMFLLLAPYIVISITLWSFAFAGLIELNFINDILSWHMYEMIYGLGIAGIIAFFLTGLPEMFKEQIPLVGKPLLYITLYWLVGRFSFWFMDYLGVYFVAFLNISLFAYITSLVAIPVFKDKKRRHFSLAYILLLLICIQVLFFLSIASYINISTMDILKLALGAFMLLILLAIKRVNMESINELLHKENIDETFYSRSPRYNLSIFCILLYTGIEFLYPNNSILAWLALASSASILGILNDFILKENTIVFKSFIIYLMSILIFMALGYGFMAYDYLNDSINALNHFRHFLATGVFGLVFYIVMIIISTIHTGRDIFTNFYTNLGLVFIILATLIRVFIPYYEEYTMQAYIISSVLWASAFIIYMKIFFPFLLQKRVDGLKG